MFIKSESGKIEFVFNGRSYPESNHFFDGNWLKVNIKIDVVGFVANYNIEIRVDELQRFHMDLINLKELKIHNAKFETMEHGIQLDLVANSRGQIICKGEARYQENTLLFEMKMDLTYIDEICKQLSSVLNEFPLVGSTN